MELMPWTDQEPLFAPTALKTLALVRTLIQYSTQACAGVYETYLPALDNDAEQSAFAQRFQPVIVQAVPSYPVHEHGAQR